MTWLIAHMWLALLLAAFFGGLIGWAIRYVWKRDTDAVERTATSSLGMLDAGEASARFAELETQLQAERNEVANLRSQLGSAPLAGAGDSEPEEGSVEWRNRYLESRVRFLEKQLAEAQEVKAAQPVQPDEEDEATRLLWRNRYLEGRVRYLEDELVKGGTLKVAKVEPAAKAAPKPPPGAKPPTLDAPRDGKADNLKQIGGVGPKIEKLLNSLGIFHFEQIAAWTDQEVAWVNSEISFKGRIEREKWVEQARTLAKGLEPQHKGR